MTERNAHHESISWLSSLDLVDGYSDGGFHPGREITRAEVAKILFNYDGTTED